MFNKCLIILTIISFTSCQKEKVDHQSFSEARYSVTITGKWQSPQFSVPLNAHFTIFTGMVHNNNTYLWRDNLLASTGVENIAEIGDPTEILQEINNKILDKSALNVISVAAPGITSTSIDTIICNSDFSTVSFESMIAPSPDWFIGVSDLNLFLNKEWVADTTLNLYVHDAGTEDGDQFGYNNPATIPPQTIELLKPFKAVVLANGNSQLSAIATVRFTKL